MSQQHDTDDTSIDHEIQPDVEANADADPGSPEWEAYIDNLLRRVISKYELGDCLAFVHKPFAGPRDEQVYSLRLVDPTDGHVEYEIGPGFYASEFEAFLRGLEVAGFGDIEAKAGVNADA